MTVDLTKLDMSTIENFQPSDSEGAALMLLFFKSQQVWSYETFGPPEHRGPVGPLKHLAKEAMEAYKESDRVKRRKEIADTLFLSWDAAHRDGMTMGELAGIALAKLQENKERVWPDWRTADPNEAVEHDRSKEKTKVEVGLPALPIELKLIWEGDQLPESGFDMNAETARWQNRSCRRYKFHHYRGFSALSYESRGKVERPAILPATLTAREGLSPTIGKFMLSAATEASCAISQFEWQSLEGLLWAFVDYVNRYRSLYPE